MYKMGGIHNTTVYRHCQQQNYYTEGYHSGDAKLYKNIIRMI